MTHSSRLLAALLGGSVLVGASLALAHGGATGVVKERMDLMEGIGKRMKVLSAIFKGEVDYDPEAVREAATGIRDHAGEKVIVLFPEGSLDAPTEALPAIWQKWEQFVQLSDQLEAYSGALMTAADNPRGPGGMMGQGQGMMGQGQGMMMMGSPADGPDPAMLASMPPDAAFMHLAETCNTCHSRFRVEKDH